MKDIDQGTKFGTWDDPVSKLLYFDSTEDILSRIYIPEKVADYGGGNGLLKEFIPHAISIDCDMRKEPDIVDNIVTHEGTYDLVVLRHVLHYLNDREVIKLFENIRADRIQIIQFVNIDLKAKYANSFREKKYFRTPSQLVALLPPGGINYTQNYTCTKEFYQNRIGGDYPFFDHPETLIGYYI